MIIINCDLFEKEIVKNGIKCFRIWKKYSAISLRIGKLFRRIGLYKFGNINPDLNYLESDCIIVFDNGIQENSVLEWLANRYINCRLIFYYWNPVFRSISPSKIPKSFELWSYSPDDCKKYNMKYNSTFFFKSFCKPPVQLRRDVFFVGKEKGRLKELLKIKKKITNLGLSSLFYITANHPRLKQKKFMKTIPYDNVLDYVNESRAVLDYYVNPKAGLSLRALEALFLGKKIITNNLTYPSYDFFIKENVFILGKEPERKISDFLSSPYIQLPTEIKERYLFSNWIARMSK
ncbi:hypothetical protein [uncultured Fibrobacter sp.]|uniref:hypothetical protein n=1 Tax=uncultured Fibrobacter sp. TaxID=261512 RepID=UPI0025E6AA00|nr:hypothetical protein [uncultured Fibrobacter sp.]